MTWAEKESREASGQISPGAAGRVYVTPDAYETSSEATAKLALPKEPTGYFEIAEEGLPGLSDPQQVEPAHGQPGGGIEQHVEYPVDASNLVWRRFAR